MIKFEHGMLVLDNTATKDDVNAINEFADYVRNETEERIIKLLEETANTWLFDKLLLDAAIMLSCVDIIKKGGTNEVS